MSEHTGPSGLRFEKHRVEALLRLSNGESRRGAFFVSEASSRGAGRERVGDLLNAEGGFVPFEVSGSGGGRVILVNRVHVVSVALSDDEASSDPGYVVAPQRDVTMLLSTGERIRGLVRVYRPDGYDRLSDWTRQPETFRYVETGAATLLVNSTHIIEVSEAS